MNMNLKEKNTGMLGKGIGQNKKFTVSLKVKVTALIVLLILTVSSGSIYLIYELSMKSLKEEIKDKLLMLAANTAAVLNADKLKTIDSPEDEGNDIYLELQWRLQNAQDASKGKIKYIYTLAQKGEKVFYVVDATAIGEDDHSSVGDEFDVEYFPKAKDAFIDATVENEPTLDPDFNAYLQSGYAPIRDMKGNVVGVLGIDMDVSEIIKEKEALNNARNEALLFSFILALLLGILFSRYLTKPILILTEATKSVAGGDFDVTANIKRNDEFGLLARSFNSMTLDLKESHMALKQYSLELEDKVAQRTAQLSQINKEIKDILDNMSQAVFTIDSDFKFNPQYSKYAHMIFGDTELAGKNMLDVFFQLDGQETSKDHMRTWLDRIFENQDTCWENLEALQPVSEIEIVVNNHGEEKTKYIHIAFQPITDSFESSSIEKVTKIMVIVQDVTEKKALQVEIQKKEQEYKDNINQIVEIIKADQELFQDFISECQENLVSFEPMLIKLKEDKDNKNIINNLFRIMHTIKGNAKIFNLERIAGEAHSIEDIFSKIRTGESVMTDTLLDETFKKLDRFNLLFNETLDIYNKITQGKFIGEGQEQSEENHKDESEVIKVKIHEIDQLAELIKKADRLIREDISKKVESDSMEIIHHLFEETEEQLKSIRKISIDRLFNKIPRMIRDTSMELGKKVTLVIRGGNINIDRNVFDYVWDPLIHILRNSIDHGIENPLDRIHIGKPEEGVIEVSSQIFGSELQLEIKDDGKGLDVDKIKAKAVRKDLISAEKALQMSDEEVMNLIFLPGFSTNDNVTDISGRGVGMDVVKTSIEKNLKGKILLESKKNQGLKVTLRIPLAC